MAINSLNPKFLILNPKCLLFAINYSLFAAFFLILSSCSFKKDIPPPSGTISKDTMQLIITDLSLSESILNNGVIKDTLSIDVLSKYHISRQRYDSSFAYYTQNPILLKAIYTHVLENLNSRK